jgi:hypothetical protein
MKRIIVFIFSLLTALLTVNGQVTVKPAGTENNHQNGIYYALPRTVLTIDVELEKAAFYAGPLANYADDFLGKNDVKTIDEETYRITRISVSTTLEPDPEQFYFVDFNGENLKEKEIFKMQLGQMGMLTGFNIRDSLLSHPVKEMELINQEPEKKPSFDYQAISHTKVVEDTLIRQVFRDTALVKEKILNQLLVPKTNKEKAREAAEMIQKIIQDRYYLSIGYQETAYDEGTMRYMDKSLRERKNEYLALFLGKTITSFSHYQFRFIPEDVTDNKKILFKFSTHSGIRSAESTIGKPVVIVLYNAGTTKAIEPEVTQMNNSAKKKGIYYRIPAYAEVAIEYDGEKVLSDRMRINQFGVATYGPYARKMKFGLDEQTGGLHYIEVEIGD